MTDYKQMSLADLMKPRWKVIADYPGNQRYVGEIIDGLPNPLDEQELERQMALYPHLFKKLEWWEERKPEELPQYFRNSNGVHRAEKPLWMYAQHNIWIKPATEEEYLNQDKK